MRSIDPFDAWFDQNISTFDEEATDSRTEESDRRELARLRQLDTIPELVAAYDEELARLEANYRAVFSLDYAILKELGVNKNGVRDGIKTKMAGLKAKYWSLLFDHIESITSRLSTATKATFVEKLSGRSSIAFTPSNVYAIVVWAIKNANQYFDEQTVQLYRAISTFDGVQNYASNARTWGKDGWRYITSDYDREGERPSHYALDYRIVVVRYQAICRSDASADTSIPATCTAVSRTDRRLHRGARQPGLSRERPSTLRRAVVFRRLARLASRRQRRRAVSGQSAHEWQRAFPLSCRMPSER
jgi:hypothetical protein